MKVVPTGAKLAENMSKNLTRAEQEARAEAESGVVPDRGGHVKLEKPKLMTGHAAAGRYWTAVLSRMTGLCILDDLDSDTLAVYCIMMERYETQSKLLKAAARALRAAKDDTEAVMDAAERLDTISGKMQGLERNILQYADKLGLTPSGRVRLAQKRAAAKAAELADPDADLFG